MGRWRFVAETKEFHPFPDFTFKLVTVYYSEDGIPMNTTLYKENGTLRLPHRGWEELKEMLWQNDNVEIEEKK